MSKRKPFIPDFSKATKQTNKPGQPIAGAQKPAVSAPKMKPMPTAVKSSGHRGGSA